MTIKKKDYDEFIKYLDSRSNELDYTEEEPLEVDIDEELVYNKYMLGIEVSTEEEL